MSELLQGKALFQSFLEEVEQEETANLDENNVRLASTSKDSTSKHILPLLRQTSSAITSDLDRLVSLSSTFKDNFVLKLGETNKFSNNSTLRYLSVGESYCLGQGVINTNNGKLDALSSHVFQALI